MVKSDDNAVMGHWSKGSLVRISEWSNCVYIRKALQCFFIPKVNHHVKVAVRVRLQLGIDGSMLGPGRTAPPQFLIGSIVILLSRFCLQNDEGPGPQNIFS